MITKRLVARLAGLPADLRMKLGRDLAGLVGLIFLVVAAAIVHPALGFAAAGLSLLVVAFLTAYFAGGAPDGNDSSR